MKTEVIAVNPSEVLSQESIQKIDDYAKQYAIAATKTAQSILELANIIFDAHKNLNRKEHEQFLVKIDCISHQRQSFLAKMRCIAQKFDTRFKECIDVLPCAYTTLYKLTQITDEQFDYIKEKNILCADLTASKLSLELKKNFQKEVSIDTNDESEDSIKFKPHQSAKCVTLIFDIENKSEFVIKRLVDEIFETCRELDVYVEQEVSSSHSFRKSREQIESSKQKHLDKIKDPHVKVLENDYVETEVKELEVA